MTINRRKFVRTGVVATAFAAVPLALAKTAKAGATDAKGLPQSLTAKAVGSAESQAGALDLYSKQRFVPHVNSQFIVRSSQLETVKVKLAGIKDFLPQESPGKAVSKCEECFSLQFTGPARAAFQQNTYEIEHAALGKLSLFIVPVGMRNNGTNTVNYEAVINRRSR